MLVYLCLSKSPYFDVKFINIFTFQIFIRLILNLPLVFLKTIAHFFDFLIILHGQRFVKMQRSYLVFLFLEWASTSMLYHYWFKFQIMGFYLLNKRLGQRILFAYELSQWLATLISIIFASRNYYMLLVENLSLIIYISRSQLLGKTNDKFIYKTSLMRISLLDAYNQMA